MAKMKSTVDWTGRTVRGVILGAPAREFPGSLLPPTPPGGFYQWDHYGLPGDWIDLDGDIWMELILGG